MTKTAVIDGPWRYLLTRQWEDGPPASVPTILFVMLNPSTADDQKDDHTIRKCIGFAKRHGGERLAVVNLFAYRATKPKDLKAAGYPVGPMNDQYIMDATMSCRYIVCAWGANAPDERANIVRDSLEKTGKAIFCLGHTSAGHPRHPLMVPYCHPLLRCW